MQPTEPTPPKRRPGAAPGARHAAKYSSPTARVNWRIPLELLAWLDERAATSGTAPNAAVINILGAAQERERRAMAGMMPTTHPEPLPTE